MIQLKKRRVVKTEVKADKSSWIYQSQYITDEDTDMDEHYLKFNNLFKIRKKKKQNKNL